jgi:phage shock protein PspC (stress-responsive transcriptional regulator)
VSERPHEPRARTSDAEATHAAPLAAPVLPPVDDPFTRTAPIATVRSGAVVAGLCAGLARRLGTDARLVRASLAALFLVAALAVWPLALLLGLLYVATWLVLPREDALPLLHEFEF